MNRWKILLLVVVVGVVLTCVLLPSVLRNPALGIVKALEEQNYARARRLLVQHFARKDLWQRCQRDREGLKATLAKWKSYRLPAAAATLFDYVERADWYRRIALHAAPSGSDEERALALFEWTVRNVQSSCGNAEGEDVGVFPLDIIKRGYGLCDRSAWVFVTLLRFTGLDGCVIYLRDEKTGESHHTIAGALLRNRIYLFDTYCGLPVADLSTGKILTFDEVVNQPQKLDALQVDGERFPMKSSDFKSATVFLAVEPEAITPEIRLAEEILAQGGYEIRLHCDYEAELMRLAEGIFGRKDFSSSPPVISSAQSDNQVALWDYPFRIGWLLHYDPMYQKRIHSLLSRYEMLSGARLAQATGRFDEAEALCRDILQSAKEPLREDAVRILCLVQFERGRFEECLKRCDSYLRDYPKGLWTETVRFLKAESLARLGRTDEALKVFDSITGARRIRARVRRKALKCEMPLFHF